VLENPSSRPGRPPRHTLDEVLDAAERLPYDRLSMTSLAKELGLVTSGLYRYVRDRDDLVAQVTARLAAALPLPDEALPWDEWITAMAFGVYDLAVAHPVITDVRSWSALLPAEGQRMIDARDRVLDAAGLRRDDAVAVYTAATNLALAYATSRIAVRGVPEITAVHGDDARIDALLRATLGDGVALLVDGVRLRLAPDRDPRLDADDTDAADTDTNDTVTITDTDDTDTNDTDTDADGPPTQR
jgi:AcrR family transcriptional regulator